MCSLFYPSTGSLVRQPSVGHGFDNATLLPDLRTHFRPLPVRTSAPVAPAPARADAGSTAPGRHPALGTGYNPVAGSHRDSRRRGKTAVSTAIALLFIELGIILVECLFLGSAVDHHLRFTLAVSRFQGIQILPLGAGQIAAAIRLLPVRRQRRAYPWTRR